MAHKLSGTEWYGEALTVFRLSCRAAIAFCDAEGIGYLNFDETILEFLKEQPNGVHDSD